jgi:hypothetical protein
VSRVVRGRIPADERSSGEAPSNARRTAAAVVVERSREHSGRALVAMLAEAFAWVFVAAFDPSDLHERRRALERRTLERRPFVGSANARAPVFVASGNARTAASARGFPGPFVGCSGVRSSRALGASARGERPGDERSNGGERSVFVGPFVRAFVASARRASARERASARAVTLVARPR